MDCQSSFHFLQINPYPQEEINNQGPKIKYPQDVVNNQGPKVISREFQPNSTPAVQSYNGKYNQPVLIQENNRMAEYANLDDDEEKRLAVVIVAQIREKTLG